MLLSPFYRSENQDSKDKKFTLLKIANSIWLTSKSRGLCSPSAPPWSCERTSWGTEGSHTGKFTRHPQPWSGSLRTPLALSSYNNIKDRPNFIHCFRCVRNGLDRVKDCGKILKEEILLLPRKVTHPASNWKHSCLWKSLLGWFKLFRPLALTVSQASSSFHRGNYCLQCFEYPFWDFTKEEIKTENKIMKRCSIF